MDRLTDVINDLTIGQWMVWIPFLVWLGVVAIPGGWQILSGGLSAGFYGWAKWATIFLVGVVLLGTLITWSGQ